MAEPTDHQPDSRPGPNGGAPSTPVTPEQVFREHTPRIYNLARRMLGSDSEAEDVTQDVLLQVVRNLSKFRGESQLSTWLHRITVNAALAHRRKRATREQHRIHESIDALMEEEPRLAPVRQWTVGPEEQALNEETHRLIEEAIGRLPEMYRDVFVLADIEGLPNAEIAGMLGLSLAAVKSRLHRARLLMRKALAPHFEEVTP
ncbi:MAG TPA: sigma-70 family RNA polymerase sigma factor [Gemmataceae bacterium]|nr:sigma-70 family RNA polymerase sigma factor [Gemmataceae bacterium]